jgi:2-keto-4-pentenoate hydratase
MPISKELVVKISENFLVTEKQQVPIEPIASYDAGLTAADAYQVQQAVVSGLERQGHAIIGKKAGATSPAAQAMLQVDEPLYGRLFDFHQVDYGQAIPTDQLINPLLECEVAFLIKQPLQGPNITASDVLAATGAVVAAFEIVDFRTTGWQPGRVEAISYNVFAARFVLGQKPASADRIDLPNLALTLDKNGEQVAVATGAAVLGNPAQSVAWLANKLAETGLGIQAGDIILSGAIAVAPPPIRAGDRFEARFASLETISIQFT